MYYIALNILTKGSFIHKGLLYTGKYGNLAVSYQLPLSAKQLSAPQLSALQSFSDKRMIRLKSPFQTKDHGFPSGLQSRPRRGAGGSTCPCSQLKQGHRELSGVAAQHWNDSNILWHGALQ